MYFVDIKNCNNITEGSIQIAKNKINIKYGINGTGKTTMSKAIKLSNDINALQELKTYASENDATVSVSPKLEHILVFDEKFVENVVFKEDEVIENSFEVFLKTTDYDSKKEKIDIRLQAVHEMLEEDEEIKELKELVGKINAKFKRSSTGKLTRSGTYKSLLSKQNLYNIPEELVDYSTFFKNTDINIPWIDWKNKGDSYDVGDKCPYCSENLNRVEHNRKKEVFKQTYTKADSQNLKEILELFEALNTYIIPEKYEELVSYIKKDTAEDVIAAIMNKIVIEFDLIITRLNAIEEFGKRKIAIADISGLENQIVEMEFPIQVFEIFGGEKIGEIFRKINEKVKKLREEIGILKKEMGELKAVMQATIRNSQNDINEFLKTAGINYELIIEAEDEENSRTILRQCFTEDKTNVTQIRQHLSWGEKNAFSLVLFMYYAYTKNPGLIILDDPISSFDSNKKYAILHRMFKNVAKSKVSLAGKTVLLLTHDFEPITDFWVVGKLDEEQAMATFVWNEKGNLQEKVINPNNDVRLIVEECADIAQNAIINIVSRVAFLRKLCELNGCKDEWGLAYEILSCLIHAGEIKRKIGNNVYADMSAVEIQKGMSKIKEYIVDFDYDQIKNTYYNLDGIKLLYSQETNAYLRLQLFRTLKFVLGDDKLKISPMDGAWYKFIDETYHIENDYLHYLDVTKFNIVPSYISEKVDEMIQKLESDVQHKK